MEKNPIKSKMLACSINPKSFNQLLESLRDGREGIEGYIDFCGKYGIIVIIKRCEAGWRHD